MSVSMAGPHIPRMGKDEWLTPPQYIKALGEFDLDPCAPVTRPWDTAKQHYTIEDDGLTKEWAGRVWLNPPYGRETGKWLGKLAKHGDGIALIFARTETQLFFEHVWPCAHAVLFLRGRMTFHHVTGEAADYNGGAPSAFIAYNRANAKALHESTIPGFFMRLRT